MSKYLLNKFLYTVDRDPDLVERYREDPRATLTWWEENLAGRLLNCHTDDSTTWLRLADDEREAIVTHDYVALFALGAHPFLTLTLFIALFERDYAERDDAEPLAFQKEYARRLSHFSLPYPDYAT